MQVKRGIHKAAAVLLHEIGSLQQRVEMQPLQQPQQHCTALKQQPQQLS